MRQFYLLGYPLVAVVLGYSLYHVGSLDDGLRGKSLIGLCLIWCCVLIAIRYRLHTRHLSWIVGAGFILRGFGFMTEPFTSHDGLRYLADGAALLGGLNPLDTPYIQHPEGFRDLWPIFYEHRQYTTIYPPLALGLFAAAASTGPLFAWWSWKALSVLTSSGLLILLQRMAYKDRALEPLFFWFALHPLVIIETTAAPHIDLFVLIPLLLWLRQRDAQPTLIGSGLLACAALIKPTILLGGLAYLGELSKRYLRAGFVLGITLVLVAVTLRIIGVASPLGADFGTFLAGWQFGSLLDCLIPWQQGPLSGPLRLSIFGILSGLTLIAKRRKGTFFKDYGDLLLIALACSPMVFPWYLLLLTPWIKTREAPIVIWWSTSIFTYEVLDSFDLDTTWSPSSWPNQLTVIILILWALSRRTKSFMLVRPH